MRNSVKPNNFSKPYTPKKVKLECSNVARHEQKQFNDISNNVKKYEFEKYAIFIAFKALKLLNFKRTLACTLGGKRKRSNPVILIAVILSWDYFYYW